MFGFSSTKSALERPDWSISEGKIGPSPCKESSSWSEIAIPGISSPVQGLINPTALPVRSTSSLFPIAISSSLSSIPFSLSTSAMSSSEPSFSSLFSLFSLASYPSSSIFRTSESDSSLLFVRDNEDTIVLTVLGQLGAIMLLVLGESRTFLANRSFLTEISCLSPLESVFTGEEVTGVLRGFFHRWGYDSCMIPCSQS